MKTILSFIYFLMCLSTALLTALGIITGTGYSCERMEQLFPEKYWWVYLATSFALIVIILIIEHIKPKIKRRTEWKH